MMRVVSWFLGADTGSEPRTAARILPILCFIAAHFVWWFLNRVEPYDFRAFYTASQVWLTGGSFYVPPFGVFPQMNWPPVALAMVPLAWLPFDVALGVWRVLQAVCLGVIGSWLRFPPWLWIAAVFWMPTLKIAQQGQIGGLMALLVVGAVLRPASGTWLGLAIALKPQLFLLGLVALVRRQWRTLFVAGALIAIVALVTLAVVGQRPFFEWLGWVEKCNWYAVASNISIRGALARAGHEQAWSVLCAAVGLVTLLAAPRAQWRVVLPAAILLSPLGWQYTAWLLAPLTRVGGWPVWIGLALVGLPQEVLPVGVLGLLLLWGDGVWQAAASLRSTYVGEAGSSRTT